MGVVKPGLIVKLHFPGADMAFKHRPAVVLATKKLPHYEVATVAMITATNSSKDPMAFPITMMKPDGTGQLCFITPRYTYAARSTACAGDYGSIGDDLLSEVRSAACDAIGNKA